MKGINLFLAYAPEDAEYRDQIGKHLSVLKSNGFLNEFCISEVLAGSDSDLSIRRMMNDAKIILLLISSDFLASNECRRLEDLAFSMKMKNDAIVIPVLLRPCLYDESYDQLQILPDNKKAISDKNAWNNEDAAFANVAERIKQLVVKIQEEEKKSEITETTTSVHQISDKSSISSFKWKPIAGLLAIGLATIITFMMWPSNNSKTTRNKVTQTPAKKTDHPIKEVKTPAKKTVPNLVKTNWRNAKQKLVTAGFLNIKEVKTVSCDVAPGTVLNQRPSSGTQISANDAIAISISEAPKKIKAAAISGGNKLVSLTNKRKKHSENAWALKNTNVEFSLEGTKCSIGDVTVEHPLGGTKKHTIRAGQKKNNTRFFGAGTIKVYFSSNDPSAVLKVRIW
ncbi:MAG: PASTA domain-containing protein [Saprospiraceae bacterium]